MFLLELLYLDTIFIFELTCTAHSVDQLGGGYMPPKVLRMLLTYFSLNYYHLAFLFMYVSLDEV